MAEWIIDGHPEWDVWRLDVRRFGSNYNSQDYIVARTIEYGRAHDELRHDYISVIRALSYAVEAKDPYTRGHTDRDPRTPVRGNGFRGPKWRRGQVIACLV